MHMHPTPQLCLVTVHVLCFMARCDGCTAECFLRFLTFSFRFFVLSMSVWKWLKSEDSRKNEKSLLGLNSNRAQFAWLNLGHGPKCFDLTNLIGPKF